jgi:hypothetical protein
VARLERLSGSRPGKGRSLTRANETGGGNLSGSSLKRKSNQTAGATQLEAGSQDHTSASCWSAALIAGKIDLRLAT